MGKLEKYQQVVIQYLEYYHAMMEASLDDNIGRIIIDQVRNQYQYSLIGWKKDKFYFDIFFHFEIIDEKIWLQRNLTEEEPGAELIRRGVDPNDYVIGFIPPAARKRLTQQSASTSV